MPHWKKQDQCFEDEQIEVIINGYDNFGILRPKRHLDKDGKPLMKAYPHDKPVSQIVYENWLEKVVNPDTKGFYLGLNKAGNPIKGTGPKHIVNSIIRFRKKGRAASSFIQSGRSTAMTRFGNPAQCTLAKPETWKRTLFTHERMYDQRTNTTKVRTTGTAEQARRLRVAIQ